MATQEYNMGCGNMDKVIAMCSDLENVDSTSLVNDTSHKEWLDYRAFLGVGDPTYIEKSFRYLPNGYTIKMRRVETGDYECLTVYNDYQNNIQK